MSRQREDLTQRPTYAEQETGTDSTPRHAGHDTLSILDVYVVKCFTNALSRYACCVRSPMRHDKSRSSPRISNSTLR